MEGARDTEIELSGPQPSPRAREVPWGKLNRVDSLNWEAGRFSNNTNHAANKAGLATTLSLAFQSIGVVFGDIGTSPLYVYASTFDEGIKNKDDILGVLSLILYTLILVPLVKYVFIVLWANDNGEGGTFALYSLLCRYARVSLIPNHEAEDGQLCNYKLDSPSKQFRRAAKIKEMLEASKVAKIMLFTFTILGTSMVIGEGALMPCISVLSAVSGIKEAAHNLREDIVVAVSVTILFLLFSVQHYGTNRIGYSFAPIILLWFGLISLIGLYNLFKYDQSVLLAFNPKYIVDYFKRNGRQGWISLGGVVLCITGTEAMFADLGHFSVRAIQLSFCFLVLPALLCAYIGQAAYLSKHPENVAETFFKSIPSQIYWPTFVIAVAAAIIGSQAVISGAFSVISQSLSLGSFPRVKVVHTSSKYAGQVYIPEINFVLMIACILVTVSFQTTLRIGHAYGIAVVAVMVLTTFLVTLIMLVIWRTSIWAIGLFFVVFTTVELIYISSVLYKFKQGGCVLFAFSVVLMLMMGIWHYVHVKCYKFELQNQVSTDYIKNLVMNSNLNRVPGIAILHSELVQGIPPLFLHFIENVPCVHSVVVFVSIKHLPISRVAMEERFLFRQVEPRESRMFRCVVKYGYKDVMEQAKEFQDLLVEHLIEFVRLEHFLLICRNAERTNAAMSETRMTSSILEKDFRLQDAGSSTAHTEDMLQQSNTARASSSSNLSGILSHSTTPNISRQIFSELIQGGNEEIHFIEKALDKGVVCLLDEAEILAEPGSSNFKKIVVNYAYNFLLKNFRKGEKTMSIPRGRLLKVGMTFEI